MLKKKFNFTEKIKELTCLGKNLINKSLENMTYQTFNESRVQQTCIDNYDLPNKRRKQN